MEHELSLKQMQKAWHGTTKAYVAGLTTCFLLTSLSFLLVIKQLLPQQYLAWTIGALALIQAAVQLKYFLHLGQEEKPQWETFTFLFMLLVLLIITIGSLWIMHSLNVRTMQVMMHG